MVQGTNEGAKRAENFTVFKAYFNCTDFNQFHLIRSHSSPSITGRLQVNEDDAVIGFHDAPSRMMRNAPTDHVGRGIQPTCRVVR